MSLLQEYMEHLFSVNLLMVPSVNSRPKIKSYLSLLQHFKVIKSLQGFVRDPSSNQALLIDELRLRIIDIQEYESKPNSSVIKKLLHDTVASFNNALIVNETSDEETPWFDAWKREFMANSENYDHEFIGAYFGILFVLDESDLRDFKDTISRLQAQLKNLNNIKWFTPNMLRYYVILSERSYIDYCAECDKTSCQNQFRELGNYHDINRCYWYQTSTLLAPPVTNDSGDNPIITEVRLTESADSGPISDHSDPLSMPSDSEHDEQDAGKLAQPESTQLFTTDCLERAELFIREMLIKGLLPWSERQLRTLNESLSMRKGIKRSFISATKQLFVMSSSMNLKNTTQSVVYSLEANEMQQRKFADLAMCLSLYDLALVYYHAARKEFQADSAWTYYAGACEAAAIASYMLYKVDKTYFEQSIVHYIDAAKSMNLAARATLFAIEVLRDLTSNDLANYFIRLTSDDSDLRSALFLERAAKCYRSSGISRRRKSAFHYVLAGHRYNRCGMKRLALSCYRKFRSHYWSFAIDHVFYTEAKLSIQVANTIVNEPDKRNQYRQSGLDLLQNHSDKQLFFSEFCKEINKQRDSYESKKEEVTIFPVKIPFVRALKILNHCDEQVNRSKKKAPSICYLNEEVVLSVTLWSPFSINISSLRLRNSKNLNDQRVVCTGLDTNLDTAEDKTVCLRFTCNSEITFEMDCLLFKCQNIDFMVPIPASIEPSTLKFRCENALPPVNLGIKIGPFTDDAVELLAGQIMPLEILLQFIDKSINFDRFKATLKTNATLIGHNSPADGVKKGEICIDVDFESINSFQFQAPFLAKMHTIFFEITYVEYESTTKLPARTLRRNIELYVRECLQFEGLVADVISLRNVLSNCCVTVYSDESEKIELMPGLTAHLLVDGNFVRWQANTNHGLISVSQ